jgi:hypothetical protein
MGAEPVRQGQMLGRDVPFPFVLGRKGRGAPGVVKDADKGTGMVCPLVLLERTLVLERGAALIALDRAAGQTREKSLRRDGM